MTHWPPKVGDPIFDANRINRHLNPYGRIVRVDREFEDILVEFRGANIDLTQRGIVRIDGQAHAATDYEEHPDMFLPGGDTTTYVFDELEGNWESSEGGEGCWKLED